MIDRPPHAETRFDWFIPIDGDGEHIGTHRAERPPSFEYLRQVVQTAEEQGYYSQLIPTRFANGLFDETAPLAETWTVATALAAVTSRIRFLIAVRPGFIAPGLFAQMAATLHNLAGGRIDINVVPGGIQGDFERLGVNTDHAQRYQLAAEFIEACNQLWRADGPVDYRGEVVKLNGALVAPGPKGIGPRWYLGGASPAALDLAGRLGDVLLMWIQPVEAIAELMERAASSFQKYGRRPSFGLRTHLVVRDTEQQAWDAAERLLSKAENSVRQQRQAQTSGTPMTGAAIQARHYRQHRIGDSLWNGISTVRVNCGTAIVGTPDQAAAKLVQYWKLGVSEFILSGYPHVEESRRVAHQVVPAVRRMIASSSVRP